jgi:hypothetical protein
VAERQRASRARRLAERELLKRDAELTPLRLAIAAEADRQMEAVEAALGEDHQGLALAERVLEGSKALVLRLYGNPLLRLAERAAMPVDELAKQLRCDRLDAAKLQQAADQELLDRLFGKAVQATRNDGAPPIVVNLVATPGMRAALNIVSEQALGGEEVA